MKDLVETLVAAITMKDLVETVVATGDADNGDTAG